MKKNVYDLKKIPNILIVGDVWECICKRYANLNGNCSVAFQKNLFQLQPLPLVANTCRCCYRWGLTFAVYNDGLLSHVVGDIIAQIAERSLAFGFL